MSRIFFYLILKPVSYLPYGVLYALSNLMYFFLYHVFGYRKKTVRQNLLRSFPEKSSGEIKTIEKAFYVHLCDITLENIKLFSMSREEAKKRFQLKNPELMHAYFQQNQSIIAVSGHYSNWEMAAIGFDQYVPHQSICIYTPLKDKFFDRKMRDSRSKYGMQMLPKGLVPRSFISNKDKRTITIFAADQSPTYSKQVHWMRFLNQETAVFLGTEVFARKYNYPVVFLKITKTRRGYYQGELLMLEENPSATGDGQLTEAHTYMLEKIIRENPAFWLWSHKRWKRKMTEAEKTEAEKNPSAVA